MHSRQYISNVEGPPKFCIDLEADWLLILGEVDGKSPGIGLGFFGMFRVFCGGGRGWMPPPIIFVVCGPIATKFSTEIDYQSFGSNMEKIYIEVMTS